MAVNGVQALFSAVCVLIKINRKSDKGGLKRDNSMLD